MPTVFRMPRLPTVILAPRGPNDVDNPDLLTLIVTPGAILIRRKSRKYPIARRMDAMSRKRAQTYARSFQRTTKARGPSDRGLWSACEVKPRQAPMMSAAPLAGILRGFLGYISCSRSWNHN